MPVTLPAHAAAVLPFFRERFRFLPPVALVVGSVSPDLSYLTGVYGTRPHAIDGLFTFCLPAGVVAWLWLEWLIFPLVRRRAPRLGSWELSRLGVTRGLPSSAKAWLWALLAILIGAATHQLWDGLTHVREWPERVLLRGARLEIGGVSFAWARVLWGISSVLGSAGVLVWLGRRYPGLGRPSEPRASAVPLLLAVGCGLVSGVLWRAAFPIQTYSGWQLVWAHFWSAVRLGCVAMSALAVVDLLTRRLRRA